VLKEVRLTGLNFNAALIDNITLYAFLAAFVLSLFFNIRGFIRKKKA
jgi:hypothetical protein